MRNRKVDNVKLVVVGDESVGKTVLCMTYSGKTFPVDYIPSIYVSCSNLNMMINGAPLTLAVWDTCGHEEYDTLRPLSYTHTDVFMICYSVSSVESLEHVRSRWIPEVSSLNFNA